MFTEHHLSHAASAFYPSPVRGSRDADAWMASANGARRSLGIGKGNEIEIAQEIHFPHSFGLLYSAFTYYTGFRVNSGEYKVMGLAPYGEPRYVQTILDHLIDLKPDGSFRAQPGIFRLLHRADDDERELRRAFSAARRASRRIAITQREMDLAASIQVVTEEVMLRLARVARPRNRDARICAWPAAWRSTAWRTARCCGTGFREHLDPARRRRRRRGAWRGLAVHHLHRERTAARRTRAATACAAPISALNTPKRRSERRLTQYGAQLPRCSRSELLSTRSPRALSTERSSAGSRAEWNSDRVRWETLHPRRRPISRRCSASSISRSSIARVFGRLPLPCLREDVTE